MLPMNKKHLPIMTSAGVAEYLPKVPRGSVYKLAQQGKIPCQKVVRHWRFHGEALDGWLWCRPSGRDFGDSIRQR